MCLPTQEAKTFKGLHGVIMVIVAQLVRAPDCGSGGRGFESRLSPEAYKVQKRLSKKFFDI